MNTFKSAVKRVTAMLLVAAMIISSTPTAVFATVETPNSSVSSLPDSGASTSTPNSDSSSDTSLPEDSFQENPEGGTVSKPSEPESVPQNEQESEGLQEDDSLTEDSEIKKDEIKKGSAKQQKISSYNIKAEEGLVLYANFDDATAAADGADGQVPDLSGNNNHGAVKGNAQIVEGVIGKDGALGKAIYITGQSNASSDSVACSTYVDFGKGSSLKFGTESFTLSAWIKTNNTNAGNSAILSNKDYSSGNNKGFALGLVPNVTLNASGGSSATKTEHKAFLTLSSDKAWHLVTGVYDQTAKQLYTYLDGALINTMAIAGAPISYDTEYPLVLGASGVYKNGTNDVLVDELRVYNRAISKDEAVKLYTDVKGVPPISETIDKDMLLYADFEDANMSATTVTDGSGKNNNGTITGTGVSIVDSPLGGKGIKIINESAKSGSANDRNKADTYINFGTELSSSIGANNFSVSFWYKTGEKTNSYGALFGNKDYYSGANTGYAFGYYGPDSKMNLAVGGSKAELKAINLTDDGSWHHFTVSVVNGGKMSVYKDGVKTGAANTTDVVKAGTTHASFPFVLGASGNFENPVTDVMYDNFRVYSKALSADDAALLYNVEGGNFAIANISKTVKALTPSLYQEGAVAAAVTAINAAAAAFGVATTYEEKAAAVKAAQDALNALEGKRINPIASFNLVSDVHIANASQSSTEAVTFINALGDMAERDNNMPLLIAGDFTSSATADQYKGFFNALKNKQVPDDRTLVALGNHDVRGPTSTDWAFYKGEAGKGTYWDTAKALYVNNYGAINTNVTSEKLYFDAWIDGYHYIVINTEFAVKDAIHMSDEQLTWLEEKVMEFPNQGDENKPVFVIVHQALNDTNWRSNLFGGFDGIGRDYPQTGEDAKVKAILAKNPNVIVNAGHIHNGLSVVEAMDTTFGTVVEIPSFAQVENGIQENGTGWVVEIYADTVLYRARNFSTKTWMPQYDIEIRINNRLPSVYQAANEIKQNGIKYTSATKEVFDTAYDEAVRILNIKYDQSTISSGTISPPPKLLWQADTRQKANEAADELTAAINGLVKWEKYIYPTADNYVGGGADANNFPANVSTQKKVDPKKLVPIRIRTKTLDGTDTADRETLLSFDISALTEPVGNAKLILHAFEPNDNGVFNNTGLKNSGETVSVRTFEDTWSMDTVTFNKAKAFSYSAAGSFKGSDFKKVDVEGINRPQEAVEVDITDAVNKAITNNKTSISISLKIPTAHTDNGLDIYSTRDATKALWPKIELTEVVQAPVLPEEFEALRLKWRDNILGGELDLTNTAVKTYVEGLSARAKDYYDTMVKSNISGRTNLWSDLNMSFISGIEDAAKVNSGNIATSFYRVRDIAYAYKTKGTVLYNDEAVKTEIIKALDHLNAKYYNKDPNIQKYFGNWWHWEIGAPIAFLSTAMVMFEHLTQAQIDEYTAAVHRYAPDCTTYMNPSNPGSPRMTGANLVDRGTSVALTGILTANKSKLDDVKKSYKTVFEYVTTGDGFYEDGTFIQHTALASMGSYGASLYSKLSVMFGVLKDSQWELKYDDGAENLVFDMVFNGIEPLFYNGRFMDMVSGRDIVRKESWDKNRGAGMLNAIIPLSNGLSGDTKQRFDEMIKYLINCDSEYFFKNADNITSIMIADKMLKDENINERSNFLLNKVYPSMDKVVHFTPNWALGLSMHSNRTYGHELINLEGKQTWNISDGMTYIYDADEMQNGEGYWASIDPRRLPGTTTELVTRPNGAGDRTKNIYPWVGGTTLGTQGIAGMQYKTLGNSGNTRSGTDVKASWFMLGNEIVAVGSGIKSETGNQINTVVDNRKIKTDLSNKLTVNGETPDLVNSTDEGVVLENVQYAHLQGNVTGSDIGYVFPENSSLNAKKEVRNGNWINQGSSNGDVTNGYATLWFNHGEKPKSAAYQYILLPGATAEETAAYAANSPITVLANSETVHAVYNSSAKMLGANFWTNAQESVGFLTCEGTASVIVKTEDGKITFAVADPTQRTSGTVKIRYALPVKSLISKSDNITVTGDNSFIEFTVDVGGAVGQTSNISFETDNTETGLTAVSVTSKFSEISLGLNTWLDKAALPNTAEFMASDMKLYTAGIIWSIGNFETNKFGTFVLEGTLVMPKDITNPMDIKAKVSVNVGNYKVPSAGDGFLCDGSSAGKTPAENGDSKIVVKYDGSSYNRIGILKFDISELEKSAGKYYVAIQMIGHNTDYKGTDIFLADANWKESTVTYNTKPAKLNGTALSRVTADNLKTNPVAKFDVTSAVKAALLSGSKEIAFILENYTYGGKTDITFYSSKNTTAGIVKPSIIAELDENLIASAPQIIRQPQDIKDNLGNDVTVSVDVSANSPSSFSYQWYEAETKTGIGKAIGGATRQSYTFTPSELGVKYYYCVITSTQAGRESRTTATQAARVEIGEAVDQSKLVMVLSTAYEILEIGNSVSVTAVDLAGEAINPYEWKSSDTRIATVDSTGKITAVANGSCFVTAKARHYGKELVASVQIEVMDKAPTTAPNSYLAPTAVKSVYQSTEYATFTVNFFNSYDNAMPAPFAAYNALQESSLFELTVLQAKGCAKAEIVNSFFTFKLLSDNRTVQIIPRGDAKKVAGSYKISLGLKLKGSEAPATAVSDILTLTVDKRTPAVSAKAVKFNTFYDKDTQAVSLTSTVGEIANIRIAPDKAQPDWVKLNAAEKTLELTKTPDKKAVKTMYLEAQVSGFGDTWYPVKLSLSYANTKPGLKLSSSSVAVSAQTNSPVELKLMPSSSKVDFAGLEIASLAVLPDSKLTGSYAIAYRADGSFTLTVNTLPKKPEKLKLSASFAKSSQTVELTLSVSSSGTLSIKADKPTVKLNRELGIGVDTATVKLTTTPAGSSLASLGNNVQVLDGAGNEIANAKHLDVGVSNDGRTVTIKTNNRTLSGVSYKVRLTTSEKYGTGAKPKPAYVDINVTIPKKGKASEITAKIGAAKLDTTKFDTAAEFKVTLNNANEAVKAEDFIVTATRKDKSVVENANDWFVFRKLANGAYSVAFKQKAFVEGKILPEYNYTITLPKNVKIGNTELSAAASVKLTVVQGNAAITSSEKSLAIYTQNPYQYAKFTLSMNGKPLPDTAVLYLTENPGNAYRIINLGGGTYAIAKGKAPVQKGKIKISVWLEGNYSDPTFYLGAKPNATLTMNINLK